MEISGFPLEDLKKIHTAIKHSPVIHSIWIRRPSADESSCSLALNLKSNFNLEDFTNHLTHWLNENFPHISTR
jgi:hypothetical protein